MKELFYLDEDLIIKLNKDAIKLFGVKKGDKHELLSFRKLSKAVNDYESFEGDFYDKAVMLLKGIVKAHAFASANRRTAFLAVTYFANRNKQKVFIDDNPHNSKIMIGIRENYYTDKELKEWIENGKKIKEFKRY